ncbi:exonuclease family protein [Synechococcus sp. A18-46.1]|nr:exonuclease family protein [Synechococcus sp. A18-46.1]
MNSSYVLFDTEYTSWEGSLEFDWSRAGEYKEIVQIAGIKILDFDTFSGSVLFNRYILPSKNPILSSYFQELTGISQDFLERHAISLTLAVHEFHKFCQGSKVFSWGDDFSIIKNNLNLQNVSNPLQASNFQDLKSVYSSNGFAVEGVSSAESSAIFEESSFFEPGKKHDALSDALSIAASLNKLSKIIGSNAMIKLLSEQ